MSSLQGKTVFLVVGNPRAGTSAVSHFLSNCGINFGDPANFIDTSIHKHNPTFFELASVNRINDEVMRTMGGRWGNDFLPIESDFNRDDLSRLAAESRQLLVDLAPDAAWLGLKDPRFCFTFPFWSRLIREAGAELRTVWSLRAIDATLASNQQLNKWPIERAWTFLIQSLLCCRYLTRNERVEFLDYDQMIAEPTAFARQTLDQLRIQGVTPEQAVSHVDPALCHHRRPRSSGLSLLDQYDARLRSGTLAPEVYLDYRKSHCLACGQFVPPTHADLPNAAALTLPDGWPTIKHHVGETASRIDQLHETVRYLVSRLTEVQIAMARQCQLMEAQSQQLDTQGRTIADHSRRIDDLVASQTRLASDLIQNSERKLARRTRSLNRRILDLQEQLKTSQETAAAEQAQLRARLAESAMENLMERSDQSRRQVA